MEMMMVMMTMLLCIRVSLLMTTAAASLYGHQVQASHELAYDQELFPSLSRKLMLQKKVEGYGVQDLVYNNEQKEALSGESHNREEGVGVHAAKGSDPTHFVTMDYSHVRRRRPIHNKSFPKATTSP